MLKTILNSEITHKLHKMQKVHCETDCEKVIIYSVGAGATRLNIAFFLLKCVFTGTLCMSVSNCKGAADVAILLMNWSRKIHKYNMRK